jgi:hypothetical protein
MFAHDPGRLQDTKSLVVDSTRPWHRIARRPFLDDCHAPSLASEENGRHKTNRSRAHDEEVDQAGRLIKVWCIQWHFLLSADPGIGTRVVASVRLYGEKLNNH